MATDVSALTPAATLTGGEFYALEQAGAARSITPKQAANEDGIFDVRHYGAKCDGTTDDGPAIQSAIDAAIADGGGTVLLGKGTMLVGSTLYLHGDGVDLIGQGRYRSTLRSNTGDILQLAPDDARKNYRKGRLADFGFRAGNPTGSGHCLVIGAPTAGSFEKGISNCVFERLDFALTNSDKAAIYSNGGVILDCSFRNIDTYGTDDGGSSPHLHLVGAGGINTNNFSRWRMTICSTRFIHLDCSVANTSNYGNVFEGINFEISPYGALRMDSCINGVVRDCGIYDLETDAVDHGFVIGEGAGLSSKNSRIENCGYFGGANYPVDKHFVFFTSSAHTGCAILYCGGYGAETVSIEPSNSKARVILGHYAEMGPAAQTNVYLTDLRVLPS